MYYHYVVLYSLACSTHPNVKWSSEIVQIGLNEANVFQTKLNTATLGSDQRLFFVFYEDNLEFKKKRKKSPSLLLHDLE